MTPRELAREKRAEGSVPVRARVSAARQSQITRQGVANAHLEGRGLERYVCLSGEAAQVLHAASARLGVSARAHHRVMKVARTIADLDDATAVAWTHVAEALRYRPLEMREGEAVSARRSPSDSSATEPAVSSKLAPRTRATRPKEPPVVTGTETPGVVPSSN